MSKRADLKRKLLETRGCACEVLPYLPHECPGAQDMHHALIDKNDVRGMSKEGQAYIDDERNCVLVCHDFHISDGRTLAYKSACVEALTATYGIEALQDYVFAFPGKLPASVAHLLDIPPEGG